MKQPIILIGLGTLLTGVVLGFVVPNVNTSEGEVLERTYVVSEEVEESEIIEETKKDSKSTPTVIQKIKKKSKIDNQLDKQSADVKSESKREPIKNSISSKAKSFPDDSFKDNQSSSVDVKKRKRRKKRVSKKERMKLDPLIYSRSIQFEPVEIKEQHDSLTTDSVSI